MIYLISFLFAIFFVYYSKYQFQNGRSGKWHSFGLLMRLTFFLGFLFPSSIIELCIAYMIHAITFDIGLNLIALNQKFNYVGKESYIDRKIGQAKWIIYPILLTFFIILKFYERKIFK